MNINLLNFVEKRNLPRKNEIKKYLVGNEPDFAFEMILDQLYDHVEILDPSEFDLLRNFAAKSVDAAVYFELIGLLRLPAPRPILDPQTSPRRNWG